MKQIAIVYHSTFSNTQKLAEAVLEGATGQGDMMVKLIDVTACEDEQWQYIHDSQAIIFGSPTYLGSISSKFKAFMEKTSPVWGEQGWNGKFAAGFCVSDCASGDKFQVLTQMMVFAAQHGMNWINLGLLPGDTSKTDDEENLNRLGGWIGAMAQRNKETATPYLADIKTAKHLGERVAQVVRQHQW